MNESYLSSLNPENPRENAIRGFILMLACDCDSCIVATHLAANLLYRHDKFHQTINHAQEQEIQKNIQTLEDILAIRGSPFVPQTDFSREFCERHQIVHRSNFIK